MTLVVIRYMKQVWRFLLGFSAQCGNQFVTLTLLSRVRWRRLFSSPDNSYQSVSPLELPVVVINLKKRMDRRRQVEAELERIGFVNVTFLDAVDGKATFPSLLPGHAANLGCTLSHLHAVEAHVLGGIPVAICEDDNQFLGSQDSIISLFKEFLMTPSQDALGLSVRVRGPKIGVSENLDVVGWALAPAFYVLKPRAMGPVIKALRKSAIRLGGQRRGGPFDQVWRWTQRFRVIFVVPKERVARQRESFSDIQGKHFGGT